MKNRFSRLFLALSAFAIVAGLIGYCSNITYYPLVVVDSKENLKVTFLQQPTGDGRSCEAVAATIGSLMTANCPTCKVTRQECLRNLSPDLRDLASEKPIPTPSAQVSNGYIAYAHPNPNTALATCMESQRQAAANDKVSQVICTPPETPRASLKNRNPLLEVVKAGLGYLAQTIAVFGAGLVIFLAIQLFAVRSPTDAIGTASVSKIDFKISNLLKRITDIVISIILLTLLFPILVLAAVLIFVLEGYPIFYISRRYIALDRCVSILKFRTMVRDATSPKYQLRERFMRDGYLDIPLSCEVYTPLGRLLERTQLVEILQLFNILFHGMSLIGNRPLPRENIELLKQFDGWERRFDSPAGLSGLSQIVGKLNQTPQERLELESLYSSLYGINGGNNFLCDLFIAYYTIRLLLFGKPLTIEGARKLVKIASGK
jgi:lipopolysaccharide/colanic/teichoic acid biosynthesis glycosyltransferase